MISSSIPLATQLSEVEITIMARENMITRARNREIKWPPETVARAEPRVTILRAVLATLRAVGGKASEGGK